MRRSPRFEEKKVGETDRSFSLTRRARARRGRSALISANQRLNHLAFLNLFVIRESAFISVICGFNSQLSAEC